MKGLTILICAIFGIASANPYAYRNVETRRFQQRAFENVINKTINDEIAKVAQHDPIIVPIRQQDVIGHSILLENVLLEGFSKVYASRIKMSGFFVWTIEVELIAPRSVQSVEHWKVDGEQFYGEGSVSITLSGLKLFVKARVSPITQIVTSLELRPTIQNANVSITGIYNNEELSQQISNYISNLLNNLGNSSYREFYRKLSNIIKDAINQRNKK